MRRKIAMLLAAAMLTMGLVGCGGTEESTTEGDASTTENAEVESEEASEEASGEKVTLTLSHLFVEGEDYYQIITPSVEKFNAENENAEIIIDVMPQDAYLTQTNARGTADDLAEIVMVNGTMMQAFADTGVIIPLDDMVAETGIADRLTSGMLAEGTNIKDGLVYSIPIMKGTYGYVVCNEEIFAEAGIKEFPKTYEEFLTACESIKAAGHTPFGLGLKDLWSADSLLFSAFVNNYVGNEWYANLRKNDGSVSLNDPQYVAALTAFQELGNKGYLNEDFASISNDERLGLFMNGQVAMISVGDWELGTISEAAPEMAAKTMVGAWPGPAADAANSNSIVVSGAWGVALGSKITDEQKEVAKTFLSDYFFIPENGTTILENGGTYVSWKFDEYDESKIPALTIEANDAVANATGTANWDSSLDPMVKEIHQRGLQELLMGSISPEELAADEQAELELSAE